MQISDLNLKISALENSNKELKSVIENYQEKLLEKENDLSNFKYEFEALKFHNKHLCKRVELLQNDIRNKSGLPLYSDFILEKEQIMIDSLNQELQDKILLNKSLEEKVKMLEQQNKSKEIFNSKVIQEAFDIDYHYLFYFMKMYLTNTIRHLCMQKKFEELINVNNLLNRICYVTFKSSIQDHFIKINSFTKYLPKSFDYFNVFNIQKILKDNNFSMCFYEIICQHEHKILEEINILNIEDLDMKNWNDIKFKELNIKMSTWLLTEKFINSSFGDGNCVNDEENIKFDALALTILLGLLVKLKSELCTSNDSHEQTLLQMTNKNFWDTLCQRVDEEYTNTTNNIYKEFYQKASANDESIKALANGEVKKYKDQMTMLFDDNMEDVHRELELKQSKINFLEDELKTLEFRFEEIIRENEILQSQHNTTVKENQKLQADFSCIKVNYEDQLTAMTDHICQINDKLQIFQSHQHPR